jgi:lipopolysaccharide/colanic/teichoic acid biosynthesis glycosyltransferase
MRTSFGAGPKYCLLVLLLSDLAAALVAGFGVLAGPAGPHAAGASLAHWGIRVVPVAAGLVGVVAISGLYDPRAWLRPRRLAGCAGVALGLIVLGAWALGELSLARLRPQPGIWFIGLAFVTAVVAMRLALAAALRSAMLPAGQEHMAAAALPLLDGSGTPVPQRRFRPDGRGHAIHMATAAPSPGDAREVHRDAAPDRAAAPLAFAPARRGAAGAAAMGRPARCVDLDTLPEGWVTTSPVAHEGWAAAASRRAFDIAGSLALLVAVLPVLVITAIAIRLESRGPVLYRQERVGKDGRVFTLFKFRSMAVDAERDGPRWALQRDPRVTRVGRIIRLTRIDEVPQILNVLRGEMALIGPRPERPSFVEQLAAVIPHYRSRTAVRPGITGWAQVNYPYGASVEDARNKLAFDLYYIQNRTVALDAAIIVGTIRVVMFQEGAR